MTTQLQSAHDALIKAPEFAAFLEADGRPGNLPYTPTMLRTALLVESIKTHPAYIDKKEAYHFLPEDSGLETYK